MVMVRNRVRVRVIEEDPVKFMCPKMTCPKMTRNNFILSRKNWL